MEQAGGGSRLFPALRLRYVVAHLLLEAVEAKLVSTPSRGGREVGPECAR